LAEFFEPASGSEIQAYDMTVGRVETRARGGNAAVWKPNYIDDQRSVSTALGNNGYH